MRNMEIAPTLKASGLNEDFKLLAEFNDCVLAGRFSGEGRAGLVDKHQLFTYEQYTEIYRMADEAVNSDFGLSGKAVEALRSICNQIEYVLPDVQERISTAAQAPE